MGYEGIILLIGIALIAIPLGALYAVIRVRSLSKDLSELKIKFSNLNQAVIELHKTQQDSKIAAPQTVSESKQTADDIAKEATSSAIPLAPENTALEEPPYKVTAAEERNQVGNEPSNQKASVPSAPTAESAWGKSSATKPHQNADAISDAFDKLADMIKDYFTGGNLIVRVGLVVLFFGFAFLLKYAADNSMFPLEYRLISVAAGGIALLLVGWRLRIKRRVYALVMQGGGVATLYLTVFAALKLYQLLPATFVFAVMVLMVALSAALAVLQNAKSLAILAIGGGFLAPILTSTGEGSHIALFSFYALLNIGILIIAWFKSWRILNLVGFVFTFVIGTTWGLDRYDQSLFPTTEAFLILFFLLYLAISILFAKRQPPNLKGYVDGTLVFGTPVIAFSLQTALVKQIDFGLAYSAFAMGALYISLAVVTWRKAGENYRLLSEAFLALGIIFASLTIPFALDGEWVATAWALEGAGILWISIRQQRKLGAMFALLLQPLSGLFFLIENRPHAADTPILNASFISGAFLAFAGLFSSYYLKTHGPRIGRWAAPLALPALIWGLCWWVGSGTVEIARHLSPLASISALVVFFSATAVALHFTRKKLDWTELNYSPAGLFVAMCLLTVPFLDPTLHPFARFGFVAWPVAFGALYWLLREHDSQNLGMVKGDKILPNLHVASMWLLSGILTLEISWVILEKTSNLGTAWKLASVAIPSLGLFFGVFHFRKRWPISSHDKTYIKIGVAGLAGFLVLWSFFSLLSNGNMAPLPYMPILNPIDLIQIAILAMLALWWRTVKNDNAEFQLPIQIKFFLAGLTFLWLSAILLRSLHHWLDIRYSLDAFMNSNTTQFCLSIFWSVIGLTATVIATKKQWRLVWITAAGLLGIVVLKLFAVDLADRDTLAATGSFIAVGLLLLIVGYFSPIPPRKSEHPNPAAADKREETDEAL